MIDVIASNSTAFRAFHSGRTMPLCHCEPFFGEAVSRKDCEIAIQIVKVLTLDAA